MFLSHFLLIFRRTRACSGGYSPPSKTPGIAIPYCHAIPFIMLQIFFIPLSYKTSLINYVSLQNSIPSFSNTIPFCKQAPTYLHLIPPRPRSYPDLPPASRSSAPPRPFSLSQAPPKPYPYLLPTTFFQPHPLLVSGGWAAVLRSRGGSGHRKLLTGWPALALSNTARNSNFFSQGSIGFRQGKLFVIS